MTCHQAVAKVSLLTGKLTFPPDASVKYMLAGAAKQEYLLATKEGYGSVLSYEEMETKNKTGKGC